MGDDDRSVSPTSDPFAPGDLFTPGSLVGERFRIVRELGQGGMGVVYEAVDEKLDRSVALKCAKAGHRNRLPPEARAAREVSHFNVCKVHDLHTVATSEGDADFLSMEFIEGETLAARIRRSGPLPPAEAPPIARPICAGVAPAPPQGGIYGGLQGGTNSLPQQTAGQRAPGV